MMLEDVVWISGEKEHQCSNSVPDPVCYIINLVGKMPQRGKVLGTTSDKLSLVPGNYMLREPAHAIAVPCTPPINAN